MRVVIQDLPQWIFKISRTVRRRYSSLLFSRLACIEFVSSHAFLLVGAIRLLSFGALIAWFYGRALWDTFTVAWGKRRQLSLSLGLCCGCRINWANRFDLCFFISLLRGNVLFGSRWAIVMIEWVLYHVNGRLCILMIFFGSIGNILILWIQESLTVV